MTTPNSVPTRPYALLGRLRHLRGQIVVTVATVAILSATVAIGQASLDYDLACRSVITSGGGTITGGPYGVIAALGSPMVPPKDSEIAPTYSVRSSTYGLRAGFLPGYPRGQTASQTTVAAPQQTFFQLLPYIHKVGRIVRGGC